MIDFKGCHYCAPMVASIYASIKIASENDATCILSRSEKLYLDNYVLANEKEDK